jgi:hypothetical protein
MIEGSGFISFTNGPDADPGDPKTYGSYGSGSATLLKLGFRLFQIKQLNNTASSATKKM